MGAGKEAGGGLSDRVLGPNPGPEIADLYAVWRFGGSPKEKRCSISRELRKRAKIPDPYRDWQNPSRSGQGKGRYEGGMGEVWARYGVPQKAKP